LLANVIALRRFDSLHPALRLRIGSLRHPAFAVETGTLNHLATSVARMRGREG